MRVISRFNFRVFFATKEEGSGTRLDLALLYSCARVGSEVSQGGAV